MRNLRPVLFSLAILASGCGKSSQSSGGGGTPSYVPPPPLLSVLSTTPSAGQDGVDRQEDIVITFDKTLDWSTVGTASVTFASPFGPLTGIYQTVGTVVKFYPAQPFPASSPILCTVRTGVRGTDGARLLQDFKFTFRSEDYPQPIASGTGLQQARIAASAGGLVMAMWVRDDNGTFRLNARAWEELTGWGPTAELAATQAGISHLKVLCTGDNKAVAVWTEGSAAPYTFRTARFVPGTGWYNVQTLASAGWTNNLYFTMHRDGWGGAGWRTGETTAGFRYLNADGSWQDEIVPGGGAVLNYSLCPGLNGELFTAHSTYVVAGYYYASRYATGSGWSDAYIWYGSVGSSSGSAQHPGGGLAYYAKDGDFLIYRQDGANWVNHGPVLSDEGSMDASSMSTAQDGRACLAWDFSTGGNHDIKGTYLDADGLGNDEDAVIVTLESLDTEPSAPISACTDNGEGWVFFSQADAAAESIWRVRYVPGTGWLAAEEIDDADLACSDPRASVQGTGGAALWLRSNTSTELVVRILK